MIRTMNLRWSVPVAAPVRLVHWRTRVPNSPPHSKTAKRSRKRRVTLTQVLGWDAPMEPEIDYVPDPELDLAIADGEALREALTEGPILVAGNTLIN